MDQTTQQTPAQANPQASGNIPQQAANPQPTKAGMQITNVAGQPSGNNKLWLWIILAIIVVGAGVAAYFLI